MKREMSHFEKISASSPVEQCDEKQIEKKKIFLQSLGFVMEKIKKRVVEAMSVSRPEKLKEVRGYFFEEGLARSSAEYRYALVACPALRDDEEFVLHAVQCDGLLLGMASDRLCDNENVVQAAIRQNGDAIHEASERIQHISKLMREAKENSIETRQEYIQSVFSHGGVVVIENQKRPQKEYGWGESQERIAKGEDDADSLSMDDFVGAPSDLDEAGIPNDAIKKRGDYVTHVKSLLSYYHRLQILKRFVRNVGGQVFSNDIINQLERIKNYIFGHASEGDPPSQLQIEPTSLCNLRCKYCVQHAGKKPGELHRNDVPSGNMDMDVFRRILDGHDEAVYLQLQGQGEPLLHPKFTEMVVEAKKRGFFVSTVTNGTVLNKNVRDQLLDSGINSVVVSLDIADTQEIESTRLGIKYEVVARNFKSLVEARDERHSNMLIGISAVITPENISKAERIINKYDQELRPDYIVVAPLASPSATENDYMRLYGKDIKKKVMKGSLSLPKMPGISAFVRTCAHINFGKSGVCEQVRQPYYRWDGSMAFCANRHKVEVPEKDYNQIMREVATAFERGELPSGCEGCHYLPADLRAVEAAHPGHSLAVKDNN